MTDPKLTPVSQHDLVQAIQHGMLFDGRKRAHHWDKINAQVAAEKLAEYLRRANFVVMRGPPLDPPTNQSSASPGQHRPDPGVG